MLHLCIYGYICNFLHFCLSSDQFLHQKLDVLSSGTLLLTQFIVSYFSDGLTHFQIPLHFQPYPTLNVECDCLPVHFRLPIFTHHYVVHYKNYVWHLYDSDDLINYLEFAPSPTLVSHCMPLI